MAELEAKNSFLNPKLANLYHHKVLIGNWYENRFNQSEIPMPTVCIKTENQVAYTMKLPQNNVDLQYALRDTGENAKVCFLNGEEYMKNMSRTNDIVYGLMRKENPCGPPPRKYASNTMTFAPQQDFTKSYGNYTHFGLVDWYKALRNVEDCRCTYSLTKCSYKCPSLSDLVQKRFTPTKRVPYNKPTICIKP